MSPCLFNIAGNRHNKQDWSGSVLTPGTTRGFQKLNFSSEVKSDRHHHPFKIQVGTALSNTSVSQDVCHVYVMGGSSSFCGYL